MPIHAPKSVADRLLGEMRNMHPRIDGGIEHTRRNLFPNWRFEEVKPDGSPEGFDVRVAENPDGAHLFVSSPGGGRETMTRQTTTPLSIEEGSVKLDQPVITGTAPLTTQEFAAGIAPPGEPRVRLESTATTGFASGMYYLSYTLAIQRGSVWYHTMPAPVQRFFVEGTGRHIVLTVPRIEATPGLHLCWFLSPVGGTAAQMRQQGSPIPLASNPKETTFTGYTSGRALPTRNETVLANPPVPRVARVSSLDWARIGDYYFGITYKTEEGETALGARTGVFSVTASNQNNMRFKANAPLSPPPLARSWRLWVLFRGQWHLSHNLGSSPEAGWNLSADNHVYGRDTQGKVFVQAEPPRTNTTGIPNPTEEPENPSIRGDSTITPSSYWIAWAYTLRGKMTRIGPAVRVTVGTGQYPRVILPHPVQALPNSRFTDLRPDGRPYDYTVPTLPAGYTASFGNGEAVFDIDSSQSGDVDVLTSDDVPVVGADGEQLEGAVELELETNHTAGMVRTILQEVNSAGSIIRSTTLKTQSAAGRQKIAIKMGSQTASIVQRGVGNIVYLAQTRAIRIVQRISGTIKKMICRIKRQIICIRTPCPPRDVVKPPPSTPKPADPKPPPPKPPPPGNGYAVCPPPPPPVPPETVEVEALDRPPFPARLYEPEHGFTSLGTGDRAWTARTNSFTGGGPASVTPGASGIACDVANGGARAFAERELNGSSIGLYTENGVTYRPHLGARHRIVVDRLPNTGAVMVAEIGDEPGEEEVSGGVRRLTFDRVDDRIQVPDHPQINSGGPYTNKTIEVRFRTGGDVARSQVVYKQGGTFRGYSLEIINGSLCYCMWDAGLFSFLSTPIQPGTVYHAGLTHQGGNSSDKLYGYLDGQSVGSATGFASIPGGHDPAVLGGSPTSFRSVDGTSAIGRYFGGEIRLARFWSLALSASSHSSFSRIDSTTSTAAVLQYRLDEGAGTTANDTAASNNNLHGQIVGATWQGGGLTSPDRSLRSLISLWLTAGGDLQARRGNEQRVLFRGVAAGNTVDSELVAGGVGLDSGLVTARIGVSSGTTTRKALGIYARWDGLDLAGLSAAYLRAGICSTEGATSARVTVANALLTERGHWAYREHDMRGRPLYQMYYRGAPEQPARDDLGPGGYRQAVIPGAEYTASIWARHDGIPIGSPARPLAIVARGPGESATLGIAPGSLSNREEQIAELVGGVEDWAGWREQTHTFTAPEWATEVLFTSFNIGPGELVFQEFGFSPGPVARRQDGCETTGYFSATLDLGMPDATPYFSTGRELLRVMGYPGSGEDITLRYRVADTISGPWSEPTEDRESVPYGRFLQVMGDATSDGLTPLIVPRLWPQVETRLASPRAVPRHYIDTLLYEDRSELPGGVNLGAAGDSYTAERVSVVEDTTGRLHQIFGPTRPGERGPRELGPFAVEVFDDRAREVLESEGLSRVWAIEAQFGVYHIRFREEIRFERREWTRRIERGDGNGSAHSGVTQAFWETEVDGVQVVSYEPYGFLTGGEGLESGGGVDAGVDPGIAPGTQT